MPLEELLKTERQTWQELGTACWVLQDFVLTYGRACTPQALPSRFKAGMAKNCFWNAQELVERSRGKYWYAEGYTYAGTLPIPILHGWAVDGNNRVIDPTLTNNQDGEYFGIVFDPETYRRLRPRGGGSILDGPYGYRVENWVKIDPGYQAVLDRAIAESRARLAASSTTPSPAP